MEILFTKSLLLQKCAEEHEHDETINGILPTNWAACCHLQTLSLARGCVCYHTFHCGLVPRCCVSWCMLSLSPSIFSYCSPGMTWLLIHLLSVLLLLPNDVQFFKALVGTADEVALFRRWRECVVPAYEHPAASPPRNSLSSVLFWSQTKPTRCLVWVHRTHEGSHQNFLACISFVWENQRLHKVKDCPTMQSLYCRGCTPHPRISSDCWTSWLHQFLQCNAQRVQGDIFDWLRQAHLVSVPHLHHGLATLPLTTITFSVQQQATGHPAQWNENPLVLFYTFVVAMIKGRVLQDNNFYWYEKAAANSSVQVPCQCAW